MHIIYKVGGDIIVSHILDETALPDSIYFEVDIQDLPSSPSETWDLSEDGVITINQEKLVIHNRSIMPTLSPIEFDLKLDQYDLYDAVHDLITSNHQLKIAYSRATYFSRTDPFVDQARIALGLTDEQIDAMWKQELQL